MSDEHRPLYEIKRDLAAASLDLDEHHGACPSPSEGWETYRDWEQSASSLQEEYDRLLEERDAHPLHQQWVERCAEAQLIARAFCSPD